VVLCGPFAFAILLIIIIIIIFTVLTLMSNMYVNYLVLVLVNYSRCAGGSKFGLLAPGHRNFIKCLAFLF
jgi:hypothetical protein